MNNRFIKQNNKTKIKQKLEHPFSIYTPEVNKHLTMMKLNASLGSKLTWTHYKWAKIERFLTFLHANRGGCKRAEYRHWTPSTSNRTGTPSIYIHIYIHVSTDTWCCCCAFDHYHHHHHHHNLAIIPNKLRQINFLFSFQLLTLILQANHFSH